MCQALPFESHFTDEEMDTQRGWPCTGKKCRTGSGSLAIQSHGSCAWAAFEPQRCGHGPHKAIWKDHVPQVWHTANTGYADVVNIFEHLNVKGIGLGSGSVTRKRHTPPSDCYLFAAATRYLRAQRQSDNHELSLLKDTTEPRTASLYRWEHWGPKWGVGGVTQGGSLDENPDLLHWSAGSLA